MNSEENKQGLAFEIALSEAEYRKTATIRAVQWWKLGDHPAVVLKSDRNRYADEGVPWINTLEGGHVVTPGDWIATGVKKEHWPIKPDVFAATYELVYTHPKEFAQVAIDCAAVILKLERQIATEIRQLEFYIKELERIPNDEKLGSINDFGKGRLSAFKKILQRMKSYD